VGWPKTGHDAVALDASKSYAQGSKTHAYCQVKNSLTPILMLSQTFCYWNKQQFADSNTIQFYLTLKCTIDQSSHFYNRLFSSNWAFHHHGGLNFTQDPSKHCYVSLSASPIIRPSKSTTPLIMHLGNIECRQEGFN